MIEVLEIGRKINLVGETLCCKLLEFLELFGRVFVVVVVVVVGFFNALEALACEAHCCVCIQDCRVALFRADSRQETCGFGHLRFRREVSATHRHDSRGFDIAEDFRHSSDRIRADRVYAGVI
jgi:hypothetical protein